MTRRTDPSLSLEPQSRLRRARVSATVLQGNYVVQNIQHFNREPVPERLVCGWG